MALPVPVLGALQTAWTFVKRFYKEIAIVLLLLTAWHFQSRAVHWHDQTEVCNSGRVADRATFAKAAADAKAKNLADVRAIEQKWQTKVTETEENYNAQLTAARADVAAYAARMRQAIAAAGRNPGGPGVPGASGTPGGSLGTGGTTLVPVPESDLYICAANTVKAEQWQDFYRGLRTSWPPGRRLP